MIDEKKRKLEEDEDFIDHPKYKNSVKKLIEKYPNGVSKEVGAKALNMTVEEYDEIFASAIKKLQANLGV